MRQLPPAWLEDDLSQLPALQLLQVLGWTYLSPDEALALREGREGNVLLSGVLAGWIREHNAVEKLDKRHPLSEANVLAAIQAVREPANDTLLRSNEQAYHLLRLGKSIDQVLPDGSIGNTTLKYIDWRHPDANVYHVTEEFTVTRSSSDDSYRPDLVLFVNGIPFAVIECKRNPDDLPVAISQHLRNQKADGIPRLYVTAQLLFALAVSEAQFGTVETRPEFWAPWREEDAPDAEITQLLTRRPPDDRERVMLALRSRQQVERYQQSLASGREVTEQDRLLWSLARPDRLLRMAWRYVVFDQGERKIARHQQYAAVERTLARLRERDGAGRRRGGVIWHTQGSGKSLTMVYLATALAEELATSHMKLVLVTDRVQLDDQIWRTFGHCGLEPQRAASGRNLIELLKDSHAEVVTTVVDKFEAAMNVGARFDSSDIIVLVDEGHRSHYGSLSARMQRTLPNAVYIGFTGTPLMKRDKSTMARFGGLIHSYTIRQAEADRAVVPLLYEGRHVDQPVDQPAIDRWFERITEPLTPAQRADLKRKFARASTLEKAERRVASIALDVAAHYAGNWKATGFKGMLTAPDKATAIRYKQFLDETGLVTSEVIISAPDDREGEVDAGPERHQDVQQFWNEMMRRYDDEKTYNKRVVDAFLKDEDPEILIVVDKLLVGFDAPLAVVLYLTRKLKDHTLLQAIARVNRVSPGKDAGFIIDYAGVLRHLDEALDLYGALPDFDQQDLVGAVADTASLGEVVRQKHAALLDVFNPVPSERRADRETLERYLGDEAARHEFYGALREYLRAFQSAMSTMAFLDATSATALRRYRDDARSYELLRRAVQHRYQEVIAFDDYEDRVRTLLDRHVGALEPVAITPPINVFDADVVKAEVERQGSPAAKADAIAHAIERTITERMDEDPVYYERFGKLLQDAVNEWRKERLDDAAYLQHVLALRDRLANDARQDAPEPVRYDRQRRALYGLVREAASGPALGLDDARSADAAAKISDLVNDLKSVNWEKNPDVQNKMKNAVEDYLYRFERNGGPRLEGEALERFLDRVLSVARRHAHA